VTRRALLLLALAFGCSRATALESASAPPRAPLTQGVAWPEAERLFRLDPAFLGGDAAISVPLQHDRVLWLFGDTFVAAKAGETRATATFVRNSVAIQEGRDPTLASFRLFPRHTESGVPATFFEDTQGGWFWPGQGLLLDGALTLFLERMASDPSPGSLGFRAAGYAAVRIDNPDDEPPAWHLSFLPVPDEGELHLVGVSVLLADEHVYAYAVREPGDHAVMLLRWSRGAFRSGDLLQPERWAGPERGFARDAQPAVVIANGAAELSVSSDPRGGYLEVQSHGFGAAPIELRFAAALEGPWSEPVVWYRPVGAPPASEIWYAGRAHPELRGAELIVTYATNSLDQQTLLRDTRLYFPRFVRSSLGSGSGAGAPRPTLIP